MSKWEDGIVVDMVMGNVVELKQYEDKFTRSMAEVRPGKDKTGKNSKLKTKRKVSYNGKDTESV